MDSVDFLFNHKAWYRRWWGKVILVLIALVISFLPFYLFQLNKVYKNYKSGVYIDLDVFKESAPYKMEDFIDPMTPWIGSETAPIEIVEWGDFNCPFCLHSFPPLKNLLAKYPNKVKIYWKNFPGVSESSIEFAKAGHCAFLQNKFWRFHDIMFARQGQLSIGDMERVVYESAMDIEEFNTCYAKPITEAHVRKDVADGIYGADVVGTPTFIVNGFKLQGVITLEKWEEVINALLPIYEKSN